MARKSIIIILSLFIFFSAFLSPLGSPYLNASTHKFWVDTSHWESVATEYVEQGYWQTESGRRWVDTSYWVNQGYWDTVQKRRWVDTSYKVEQGYWQNYTYQEWVNSGYWHYYPKQVWVDTSHYETRYRTVDKWVSCNKVFVTSHNSGYSWGYTISNLGNYTGTISGTRYKYKKYFYNYVALASPSYDYFRYECYQELKTVTESYNVWVSSGYYTVVTAKDWIDTSHYETRTGRRWVDTSYWVNQGYWDYYTERVWVDTSYKVTRGYWEDYTENVWVDTSHWIYEDVWVEEGHWVEADINLEGRVLHTLQWDKNRISYNLSKTGTQDNPRGYDVFFNGEKFILNAYAAGDFEPDSVHVKLLDTVFETDLTNSSGNRWEGYIWDKSFINFHNRDCVFKFTAHYDNGIEIEDEVTVYIVRDFYWLLHRGF